MRILYLLGYIYVFFLIFLLCVIGDKNKWINQTLITCLVVIFYSLLTEEFHQAKHFFAFFYILTIEEIDKLMENVKRYKGVERL